MTPHGKEMFKKKGDAWANSGLACVLSVLFTPPLGDMISLMKYLLSRQLYIAYFAVFLTWVSCLTPKFGAHNRKMSLQKFPRKIKKDKMRICCDSVPNVYWRSKHVKYN